MAADPARRLLTMVTALMPPGRRAWGRAMLAELEHVHSPGDRARLVLGAVRVALVPPPWLAGYGLAAGRACLVAVVACVPLSTGIYLSNVVFPAPEDSTLGVASSGAYLIVTLMTAGAIARRPSSGPGGPILAGAAAGLVVAALSMATFAVIDNAFLSVVMHQTNKLQGFQASGLTSMRAYINAGLEATAPGVAIYFTLAGAFLGALGSAAADALPGALGGRGQDR